MERETGYYWVKPRHWPFYDKWVVAKYSPRGKDYPDWELGAGRYDDENFKEINETRIPTPDEKKVLKEQWESISEYGPTINEFMDSQPVYTRSQLIQFGEYVKKACAECVLREKGNGPIANNILSINLNDLL